MTALALSRINVPRALWFAPLQWAKKIDWTTTLTTLTTLLVAMVCGYAIPILGAIVPAVISAMLLCLVVLALPAHVVVKFMLGLVMLIVGQLTFFFGIQQAFWLPYLLLLLLGIKYLIEKLRFTSRVLRPLSLSNISVLICLFCILFFLSALSNSTDVTSFAVAAKNYLLPWILTLFVASQIRQTGDLDGVWKFFLWMVVVQVPFAIPQHFYFAKRNGASLDAVVGSFGGNYLTGGASGAMAVFLVFGIVLAVAFFRRHQIGRKTLLGILVAALVTIALAEVKIFFFVLPLALVLLFRWDLIAHPTEAIGYGLTGAAILALLLFSYQQTASSDLGKKKTLGTYIENTIDSESDPYFVNPLTKEVSRIGAILSWFRYNDLSDPRFYVGHGPAASRVSQTLGSGVAARKYRFTLTTSTASTLLWDVGFIGYSLFIAVFSVAGLGALRLASYAPPKEKATLEAIGVMLLLSVPLSVYNRDLIDSAVMQTLVAFWIGYVLLCRRSLLRGSWQLPLAKTHLTF
ncbi:hypothetical protein [Rhodoferax sp.]|uniref:hypothetical protein n=1 Tax=Rhodoferax sp. TaxID=50421 RepID=UPI001ED1F4E6|nr:hypothetical protein [Rhodoferax sp.]MBT9507769.1 hypothetical protein [Rhodoferax sp.]